LADIHLMPLRRRVLEGGFWVSLSFGVSQFIRLIANVLLARLLFEDAFALMAIVNGLMMGLAMLSDIGVAASVIHNKRGDDRDYLNTAWTLNIIRGAIIAAIATLAAYPISEFYAQNDPAARQLLWLMPVVALSTLVASFASSRLWTATRHVQLARPALIDFIAQVTSVAFALVVAAQTKSVMALAASSVVSAAITVVLSYWMIPGQRNAFRLDREAILSFVDFGKWVFLSTMITFFAMQLDRLVFARFFDLTLVGVYAIAASLTMLLPDFMSRIQTMIFFPAYSRLVQEGQPYAAAFEKSKLPLLIIGSYLAAVTIACAESFVSFAYDDRYIAAGLYIQILTIASAFSMNVWAYFGAFAASGNVRTVAITNASKVIAFVALVYPATILWGFVGAIWAVVAAEGVRFFHTVLKARAMGLKRQSTDVGLMLFAISVGLGVNHLSEAWSVLSNAHDAVLLLSQATLVTLAFLPWAGPILKLRSPSIA
jgi:O-antigen/teichoic acid export membrane protein